MEPPLNRFLTLFCLAIEDLYNKDAIASDGYEYQILCKFPFVLVHHQDMKALIFCTCFPQMYLVIFSPIQISRLKQQLNKHSLIKVLISQVHVYIIIIIIIIIIISIAFIACFTLLFFFMQKVLLSLVLLQHILQDIFWCLSLGFKFKLHDAFLLNHQTTIVIYCHFCSPPQVYNVSKQDLVSHLQFHFHQPFSLTCKVTKRNLQIHVEDKLLKLY